MTNLNACLSAVMREIPVAFREAHQTKIHQGQSSTYESSPWSSPAQSLQLDSEHFHSEGTGRFSDQISYSLAGCPGKPLEYGTRKG